MNIQIKHLSRWCLALNKRDKYGLEAIDSMLIKRHLRRISRLCNIIQSVKRKTNITDHCKWIFWFIETFSCGRTRKKCMECGIILANGMDFHIWGPISLWKPDITNLIRSQIVANLRLLQQNRLLKFKIHGDSDNNDSI